ncbi:hypothetical protein ACTXJG_13015 [Glutamicibacter arilaitensis]|uniref:hypothetical protein n=1 Tax=Glutamicibacter arilaitensis TaxID=256701 RepID=UPI003FD3E9EA
MASSKTYAPVISGLSHNASSSVPTNTVSKLNEKPVIRGNRHFWLDGSVILNGTCLRRTEDLQVCLPEAAGQWSIEEIADWWSNGARNPGALFVEDAVDSWSACFPDPLGGAVAFSLSDQGKTFVSTSIVELVKAADTHGISLEKDPLFQIERLMLGNGGLTPSSYKGVKSLEPFEYFVLDGNQVFTKKYKVLDNLATASLHDLFTILRRDVQSAVQAIADSDSQQVISHLTGGFDSRLVLSAVLNLGLNDRVNIFCSGPEGSTDRIIADGLTRQYGLKRVDGAGLTTAPTTNMSERLMGALFASGGITNTGPFGREISVPVSAMGGGYGEVLRTFFGNRKISNSSGSLDNDLLISGYLPSASSNNTYVSPTAISEITNLLSQKFGYLANIYQDLNFLGDAFYTHNRNRYHIGQTSLLWSRVGSRFDPLYSVAGFELSRRSTQHVRSANLIGHDLLDSLKPDLLAWPFDYDRYNQDLLEMRKRQPARSWPASNAKIDYSKGLTPECESDSSFLSVLRRLNATEPKLTAAQRKSKVQEANGLGVNFWQIVYRETGQELLANAFEQTNGTALQGTINTDYIHKLATSNQLNKKQLRDLYSLGGIMSWLSFG